MKTDPHEKYKKDLEEKKKKDPFGESLKHLEELGEGCDSYNSSVESGECCSSGSNSHKH